MNDKVDRVSAAFSDPAIIDKALAQAVMEAILEHKRAGRALPTWRDGRVVWLPPEEIPERLEPAEPES